MPGLTDDELRAIAYYVIGVGSEGKDVAYRLSFAGNQIHQKNGTTSLQPIGNSGYSVGELQTDLGQRTDDAKALVDAYQAWAHAHHPDWVLSRQQQAQYASDLGRDGHHIRDANYTSDDFAYRAQHHAHIPSDLLPRAGADIDPTFKSRLDAYLATDDGKSFVHGLDVAQVDELMDKIAKPLKDNVAFFQNSKPEEQARIFAVTAKAYNQSPTLALHMLDDMGSRKVTSLAGIEARINAFPDGPSHYMHTGRDAALQGAELFNALRNAREGNPLHGVWQTVSANPLADPAQISKDTTQPHSAAQYATIKSLFVEPAQGQAFVAALDGGASYNHGDPGHTRSRGLYAEGQDFLQWDRDGRGHAFINGQWSEFSRHEISLIRNPDHTLDVTLARNGQTQRLLHVAHPHLRADVHHAHGTTVGVLQYGARNEAVESLQTRLAGLGYTGRDEHALRADGDFGTGTLLAVEAFQHDHGLAVDGKVGPHTQQALGSAAHAIQATAHARNEAPVTLSAFNDPTHPQRALYAAFKQWLPQGTSEDRLAQATAACYSAGMKQPEDVAGIYSGGNGKILFTTNSLFANMAEMDVSKPAPTIQQSLQRIQQFDQQQQMQAPQQAMQQQPTRVVLHQ